MVESLNRITRLSSGQIDILQIQSELKEVELREVFEVLERSFLDRPAQKIILDLNKLQVLSQGAIELLRKLVGFFQSYDLPLVFIGTERLSPAYLIEVSKGSPVMETLDEAKEYFDARFKASISKTLNEDVSSKEPEPPTISEKEDNFTEIFQQVYESEQTFITPPDMSFDGLTLKTNSFDQNHHEANLEKDKFKEIEFNDEISTMVVDGKEDELKFHDSLGVVEHPFEGSETDESLKNKQRRGGLFLIGITIVISLVMAFSFPVVEETKFWKTLWEKTPLKWVNHMLQVDEKQQLPVMTVELGKALEKGNTEEIRLLLKAEGDLESRDEKGHTPLMKAVIYRNPELLQFLLDQGANPNVSDPQGDTPLVWAASKNQNEMVTLLLQHGAEPNRGMFNSLMWASFHGNEETVEHLLSHGSQPDLRSRDGWSALMWASERGHQPVVQKLLASGAGVNLQNSEGYTPLMLAVKRGRTETVKTLLSSGADIGIQGFDRKSAIDLAIEYERKALLPLLHP